MARTLADGAVRPEHFENDAQFDPTVRALMARISARPHPDMPDTSPLQWGAEVVVTTRDGERFASRLDRIETLGNIADLTRLPERQDTAATRRTA